MALLTLALSITHSSMAGVSQLGNTPAGSDEQIEPAKERQRPAGDRELPMAQNSSGHPESSSVIKCWQYGRLIVDERNWRASHKDIKGSASFRSEKGHYKSLDLLQFGDTFCLTKQASRQ